MPFNNQFSYEQTVVVRTAVSLVFSRIDDAHSEKRRREVASVILKLASEHQCDADALALVAMNHLKARIRETEIADGRGKLRNWSPPRPCGVRYAGPHSQLPDACGCGSVHRVPRCADGGAIA